MSSDMPGTQQIPSAISDSKGLEISPEDTCPLRFLEDVVLELPLASSKSAASLQNASAQAVLQSSEQLGVEVGSSPLGAFCPHASSMLLI